MAGSAATPTSLVEISISCRGLRDTDVFSKSDPMCVVAYQPFGTTQWTELKRTECIDNTLDPDFSTKLQITYHFEEIQKLRFSLYDLDSNNPDLSNHDFLGSMECTLGQLVSSCEFKKPLIDPSCKSLNCGTIILTTEELVSCKEELTIQMYGRNHDKLGWFCSNRPFLEFYKSNESGTFTLAYRTNDQLMKSQNPVWKEFTVPMHTFCSGDYDRNIKVRCMNFHSNGSHDLIGEFYTTVRKLKEGPGHSNTYTLENERKKGVNPRRLSDRRKGASYKGSGEIILNKIQTRQVYSFLDYIKGGTEMNAFIGIDFTASNGNPQSPQSLHYFHPDMPNQYVRAIQSVGEIIEDYDDDKFFPVLGFGARMPPDFTQVSHEFFVNGHPNNPFCERVQGVIDAYYNCLNRVQLYGPTNFAPIINHVARFAASHRSGDKYFILLILTDGIITDMPQTKEAIVNASCLPLSIIIVGVGGAEFDSMEELDGDVVRLSSRGRYAERDIVQFVPFRDFLQGGLDPHTARQRLAREVLAEVPHQFISYMKANGIIPKQPLNSRKDMFIDPTIGNVS
ncbi:copine-8-like [Oratosquilla oratoria]|uniref:copine-8-like n=1 Tax=Oratosquilla oratoria TaxID=337810 RepID=UPI003F75EFBE